MLQTTFHRRPAVQLENDRIRVTVLVKGGHIAEILDKSSGVSPLWIPPWTDEPSPDFGNNPETPLLRDVMGHNLCLDLFGPPSDAEAAAGVPAHGEASLLPYDFDSVDGGVSCRCTLRASQLAFERVLRLDENRVWFEETVENLAVLDRPVAWTQHVTLGPPFLERGVTRFGAPIACSKGIGDSAPQPFEIYTNSESSAGFTTHLMDPAGAQAWFFADSPTLGVRFGYFWDRADFPWLGVWEENHSRTHAPWNGRTMTRGMEFGVSPFPETRRAMIERGTMFGVPCFRWIGANSRVTVRYRAEISKLA